MDNAVRRYARGKKATLVHIFEGDTTDTTSTKTNV